MRLNMKLFVDDLRDPPDETWTTVRDIELAKKLIAAGGAVDLSLDHDMGGDYHQDGSALVMWIAEHSLWPKNKPTVHSANPVGRNYMVGVIERYGPY